MRKDCSNRIADSLFGRYFSAIIWCVHHIIKVVNTEIYCDDQLTLIQCDINMNDPTKHREYRE